VKRRNTHPTVRQEILPGVFCAVCGLGLWIVDVVTPEDGVQIPIKWAKTLEKGVDRWYINNNCLYALLF